MCECIGDIPSATKRFDAGTRRALRNSAGPEMWIVRVRRTAAGVVATENSACFQSTTCVSHAVRLTPILRVGKGGQVRNPRKWTVCAVIIDRAGTDHSGQT